MGTEGQLKTVNAASPPERHAMNPLRRPELAEELYACPHGRTGHANMELSILRHIL
jgi:hypothetical protein